MTTFKINARKPRVSLENVDMSTNPLANRHRRQREARLNKITLWANDPAWRPARPVVFAADVKVDALTYARANLLRDEQNLTCAELLSDALALYCELAVRQNSIKTADPALEKWVNEPA